MAEVRGSRSYISASGADISTFSNNVSITHNADTVDVSTFGVDWHQFASALRSGTFNVSGVYDSTTSGPHDTLGSWVGEELAMVYRPEGTGSGLPATTFQAILSTYTESAAVADMVQWAANLQSTGAITQTDQ